MFKIRRLAIFSILLMSALVALAEDASFQCPRDAFSMITTPVPSGKVVSIVGIDGSTIHLKRDRGPGDHIVQLKLGNQEYRVCVATPMAGESPALVIRLQVPKADLMAM